jgi:hypothetical protein
VLAGSRGWFILIHLIFGWILCPLNAGVEEGGLGSPDFLCSGPADFDAWGPHLVPAACRSLVWDCEGAGGG